MIMRTEELLKGASMLYCFIRKNENKLEKSGRGESQLSWSDCPAKLCSQPYYCFLQVAAPFMLQLKYLLAKASWRAQSTTGAWTGREQTAQVRELCYCRCLPLPNSRKATCSLLSLPMSPARDKETSQRCRKGNRTHGRDPSWPHCCITVTPGCVCCTWKDRMDQCRLPWQALEIHHFLTISLKLSKLSYIELGKS